jgi:hypothetical protein
MATTQAVARKPELGEESKYADVSTGSAVYV